MIDPLWKGLQFWLVMNDRDSVLFIFDNYLSILSPCIIYHTRVSQCTGITSEVSAKFGQVLIDIDTFHIFIFPDIFKFLFGRVHSLAHIPRCEFVSWNTYEIMTIFGLPKAAKWRIFLTRYCVETKFRHTAEKVTKFRRFWNVQIKFEIIPVYQWF